MEMNRKSLRALQLEKSSRSSSFVTIIVSGGGVPIIGHLVLLVAEKRKGSDSQGDRRLLAVVTRFLAVGMTIGVAGTRRPAAAALSLICSEHVHGDPGWPATCTISITCREADDERWAHDHRRHASAVVPGTITRPAGGLAGTGRRAPL